MGYYTAVPGRQSVLTRANIIPFHYMEPREIGPIHSAGDDRAQNCSTFELNESQQQILNELDEVIQ